jgi:hypothetical protein
MRATALECMAVILKNDTLRAVTVTVVRHFTQYIDIELAASVIVS